MTSRPRVARTVMSPAACAIVSIAALASTPMPDTPKAGICLAIAAALAILWAYQAKARRLFKGVTAIVVPFFILLQLLSPATASGIAVAIAATLSLLCLFAVQHDKECTRLIFTLALIPGLGLFVSPLWLGWAAILLLLTIPLGCFSLRALFAAILGLVTPVTALCTVTAIFPAQWLLDILEHTATQFAAYRPYLPGDIDIPYVAATAICLIAGGATYVTAYGYPAKSRQRNMSLYLLTIGLCLMPLADFCRLDMWLTAINLCAAYHLSHLCATRSGGWAVALIVWTLIYLLRWI